MSGNISTELGSKVEENKGSVVGEFGRGSWSSPLDVIEGVGRSTAYYLEMAGLHSVRMVADASLELLQSAAYHVGEKRSASIKEAAQALVDEFQEARRNNQIRIALVGDGAFIADKPHEVVTGMIESAVDDVVDDGATGVFDFTEDQLYFGIEARDDFGDRISTWIDQRYVTEGIESTPRKETFEVRWDVYGNMPDAESYSDLEPGWEERMEEIPFVDRMNDTPFDVEAHHPYLERRSELTQWADLVVVLTDGEFGWGYRQSAQYNETECYTKFSIEHSADGAHLSAYSPGLGDNEVSHYVPDDEETFANVTRRADDGLTQSDDPRAFYDGDLMSDDGDIGVDGATYGVVDDDEHRNTEEFTDGKGKGTTGSNNWGA